MANAYYDVGVHVGLVTGQGLTQASTGTAQFVLRVKVLGVPDATLATFEPHDRQYERSIYLPLTEKTMSWVVPILKRLGFTGTSVAQLDLTHPDAHSFVGNQVELWCGHQDDPNGGVKERWNISSPTVGQLELKALGAKQVRQLDALFGKALGAKAKATPSPSRVDDITTITDDDIPF
jgi:hypothetical protein